MISVIILIKKNIAPDRAAELYKANRGLAERILDFLSDLVDRVANFYQGVSPQSELGRKGQEIARKYNEVYDLYIQGIRNAAENMRNAEVSTNKGKAMLMARHRAKVYHVLSSGVFPQFDEADSDASEQAIRWARKENVLVGDQ